jgi:hypothetical protein
MPQFYAFACQTLSTADCDVNFEKLVVARYVRLVITGWGRRTGFVFQLYGTTGNENVFYLFIYLFTH